jgi:hypothetical protein
MLTSWRTAPRRPPSPRRLRRHGRRWPWLLTLLPLAAVGAFVATRDRSPRAAVDVAPTATTPSGVGFAAPHGERTTGPRCVMVVVDESSSMADADRAGTRADAVTAAAGFLGAYGVDGDRIGTTWFADSSHVQPPLEPAVAKATAPDLLTLGSGTRIGPALEATFAAMDASCGAATGAVVLVSDGAADAGDYGSIVDALGRHTDVAVHLIAMNGGGAFEPSRSFWEDDALGLDTVQTIDSFGRDEVSAAMATVLSAETGQQVVAS